MACQGKTTGVVKHFSSISCLRCLLVLNSIEHGIKHCYLLIFMLTFLICTTATAQSLENTAIDGYRGIWFELNQKFPYGDKYSGGLGTYTAKHMPMAIYSQEVDKTFFVYGGTVADTSRHLLCMIGYYDHQTNQVPKPVVVCDKLDVDDPHDNPSLLIDDLGYLWVFVSGRSTKRPGFKYRSSQPYDISQFGLITEEEMTYPQPWFDQQNGMFHFFTKYSGTRELYFEHSPDGVSWSEDKKLAGIVHPGFEKSGHYQVSGKDQQKIGTFFNRHIDGHPDTRTDLYYCESLDWGSSWQSVDGQVLTLPLRSVENAARVFNYFDLDKNVYMKDMQFDNGRPICLYLTSGGHEPGPDNAPYEWKISAWRDGQWQHTSVTTSDHNYDMGSLYLTDSIWYVIGPTSRGPQQWAAGGEIVIWTSSDQGGHWKKSKQVTRNSAMNHTYIRRPQKAKQPFYYYWADGNPVAISRSSLYFGNLAGEVWQLPYQMIHDFESPVPLKLEQKK